jgi:outer membrane protein assembly factor BamD (BamD/ComL family)
MINEKKFQTAIGFLEVNLNTYLRQQKSDLISEPAIPKIYFLLARAKEDIGAPKKEIAKAYNMILKPSRLYHAPEWSDALIWLMENGYQDKCSKAIESFIKDRNTEEYFRNTVAQICQHFEKEKKPAKFHWFMDTLFAGSEYPCDWAFFVQTCLDNTSLGPDYDTYLDGKPKLRFGMDCIIGDKYAAEEKYNQAAEVYRDIVSRCGPENDKAIFELKFCKCMFEAGRYQEVVEKSDSFISSYKATHRNLAKEALLMKGRAHIQLAEAEKAINPLLTFLIEYPNSNHAPETNFILGYCYMLLGKFNEATAAFNLLISDYPESSYVAQADSYLQRIKNMTE